MKLFINNRQYKEGNSIRFKYDNKYGYGSIKKIEFNKQKPGESIITVEAGFKWKERFDSKPSNIIKIKANQILSGDNFSKVMIRESNKQILNFADFVNEKLSPINEREVDLGSDLEAAIDMIETKLDTLRFKTSDPKWKSALNKLEDKFDRWTADLAMTIRKLGVIPIRESLNEREYSEEERKELASKGMALPDGSYPIKDVEDLKNAIQAYGRAKNQPKAAKFIAKRAKALGVTDLIPDSEDFQNSLKEEGNTILEGKINYSNVYGNEIKDEKDLISILNTFDNFAEMSDDSKEGDKMYSVITRVKYWADKNNLKISSLKGKLNDNGKTALKRYFS